MKQRRIQVPALFMALAATVCLSSCKDKKPAPQPFHGNEIEENVENDSTIYGLCGEDMGMSTFTLITDQRDTLTMVLESENAEEVKGGKMPGDKMAVVAQKGEDGDYKVHRAINLTSLLGKWTSIDKNFEIQESGDVKSFVKAETNPWTSWKIVNGRLLLNRDTFDIDVLGSDSLSLENSKGIFTYKRQK